MACSPRQQCSKVDICGKRLAHWADFICGLTHGWIRNLMGCWEEVETGKWCLVEGRGPLKVYLEGYVLLLALSHSHPPPLSSLFLPPCGAAHSSAWFTSQVKCPAQTWLAALSSCVPPLSSPPLPSVSPHVHAPHCLFANRQQRPSRKKFKLHNTTSCFVTNHRSQVSNINLDVIVGCLLASWGGVGGCWETLNPYLIFLNKIRSQQILQLDYLHLLLRSLKFLLFIYCTCVCVWCGGGGICV